MANSIWGHAGHPFLPAYLDLLRRHYGAAAGEIDSQGDPEESRQMINDWVSQKTEGRIENLIPPGGITPLTKLVLGNAIYFQAGWLHPFDEAHTRDDVFSMLDSRGTIVPMMRQEARLAYAAGAGWQAVELPYEGGSAAMLVLLPDLGHFEEFESTLSEERVSEIVTKLQTRSVCLIMPKFRQELSLKLRQALVAMGMEVAFLPGADFSGMDGTRDLYLDEVYHKSFIAVDEAGTEAAAATAVAVTERAPLASEPCVVMTVNRPFVFLVRDAVTSVILFGGRILEL
jgi:serpin B